jgi:hypothetical protein
LDAIAPAPLFSGVRVKQKPGQVDSVRHRQLTSEADLNIRIFDLIQVLDEFRVVGISRALVKAFYGCE